MYRRKELIVTLTILLGVLWILAFAWFVWPSRYQHRKIGSGGLFGQQTIRLHRFTGEAQVCGGGRWQEIEVLPNGSYRFPSGTTITVGVRGDRCPRVPWIATALLAVVAVGEAGLVLLLRSTRRAMVQASPPEGTA
jgi:hypothetical protein